MAQGTKNLLQSVAFWSLLLGIFCGVIKLTFTVGSLHRDVGASIELQRKDTERIRNLEQDMTKVKTKLGITAKPSDPLAIAGE